MSEEFDRDYWDAHWTRDSPESDRTEAPAPAHPSLATELAGLPPGTALEAGCGEGGEALWLAAHGWSVTGADISSQALSRARERAVTAGLQVEWLEADLSTWEPAERYDLVTTFYAHPTMPQLAFYERIARWVRPGGTLLIVGHRRGEPAHHHDADATHRGHGSHDEDALAHASVQAAEVTALLDPSEWRIETAQELPRTLGGKRLDDVIVRATRTGHEH